MTRFRRGEKRETRLGEQRNREVEKKRDTVILGVRERREAGFGEIERRERVELREERETPAPLSQISYFFLFFF